MKKDVRVPLESFDYYALEGTFEDAIKELTIVRDRYVGSYEFRYKSYQLVNEQEQYSDRYHLMIYGVREETDEEKQDRISKDAVRREYRRQEYLKLKKEFGDGA